MQWVQLINDLIGNTLFAAFHFKYWWDLCILLDSFDVHLFSYDEEKIKKNSITNMYVISFLFHTFCLQLYLKGTFCLFCLLQNFPMMKYLFQTVFNCAWCFLIKSKSTSVSSFLQYDFINKSCFFFT